MDTSDSKRRYLIDEILPARQVHIIGGHSGVGKTRWTFASWRNWLQGEPIFGFSSHPEPTKYFATDRNADSLYETLRLIGALDVMPWESVLNSNKTIEQIIKANPVIKVFIFDSLMTFVPGYKFNDYGTVSEFLRGLTHLCYKYDVTIIGMLHTTKLKENATILNPREKLLGSVAWAAYAETLLVLGCDNLEHPDEAQTRYIHVLPRNAAEFKKFWRFGPGGVPQEVPDPQNEDDNYLPFIESLPTGIVLNSATLVSYAKKMGISRSTLTRYLSRGVKEFDLKKKSHGHYERIVLVITHE